MIESDYQTLVLNKVKAFLPTTLNKECLITKLDSGYIQGIPDWLILYGKKWATLEIKRTKDAHKQPNQSYYVSLMRNMGYSSFIYPENEQQVLKEVFEHFKGEIENDLE